jgi:2'-5' RNA ligase
MRLFTAIDLPPDMLLRLERLIIALRPEALINWSPLDNLHITTKFIGEWPESRLPELHAALGTLTSRPCFEVEIAGMGWFPTERAPRVLWVGVEAGEALPELAQATEECLQTLGVAKEERKYSPHLTLARVKHQVPLGQLRRKLADLGRVSLGTFAATGFALYRSEPGSNASIYRKLQEYQFESSGLAANI